MSTLSNFDIDELILQLHGELKFAFEVANSSGSQAGLQLDNIKVKFGKENIITDTDSFDPNILNSNRYPNEDNWELELSYKYGDPFPDLPQSENWTSNTTSRIVLDRLSEVDIRHIKGINTHWRTILIGKGISNIGELAKAHTDKLLSITNEYRSLLPIEFQTKVLLLIRSFKPFQYKQYGNMPISNLLRYSIEDLKNLYSNKLSSPEISELRAMASIIFLSLDKNYASKLTMSLFTLK